MRRLGILLLFLSVFLTVLVGGHTYLVKRLILDPGFEEPARSVLLACVVALAAILVLYPIVERTLRPAWSGLLAWPASIWMGFAFLLLVGTGLSDLLLLLLGAAIPSDSAVDVARVRAFVVVGVATVGAGVGLAGGLGIPAVKRVTIRLPRWPEALEGLRIVQISDIHIGAILGRRFAEGIVERVNALDGDLVAVTGDLVDGSVEKLAEGVAPFARLRGALGVYFVTGNHDVYSGTERWVEKVRELGFRVLRNERVTLHKGGGVFDLAGVDDHHAHHVSRDQREDLPAALEGVPSDRPVVLLAHDPSTFKEASRLGVDLQLSGHTHGGQIWPFGHVVRLVIPFVAGLYRRNGSTLYVSRGTGFWGPPMRLFAPAEITEIIVKGEPGLGESTPAG